MSDRKKKNSMDINLQASKIILGSADNKQKIITKLDLISSLL